MLKEKLIFIQGTCIFILIFLVYLFTLAPTVTFIDSGELSAVATTLGIAHPTGYPLFTIIGFIFTKFPFSADKVYNLNMMSAFFCALSAGIFFLFISHQLTTEFKVQKSASDKKSKSHSQQKSGFIPSIIKFSIAAFSSLVLAFSNTYWSVANSVEVYSLHIFFIISILFTFWKAVNTEFTGKEETFLNRYKYYFIFAFLTGLSFTNHMTTILLTPACLVFFILKNLRNKEDIIKLLGLIVLFFIAGFSVYLYLPVRAAMNPTFLWGNPYNFERFIWHITGKQFSVWIFSGKGSISVFLMMMLILLSVSVYGLLKKDKLNKFFHFIVFIGIALISYIVLAGSTDVVSKQFSNFLNAQWKEYGTGIFILSLAGLYMLSKENTGLFYFTMLTFFTCVFYSVNYDIHDIDSYFLLSYITVVIWIAYGALFIFEKFRNNLSSLKQQSVFAVVVIFLSSATFMVNFKENNESNNVYVEEFTYNIFKNLEPNSIVISSQWDFWVSASWYYSLAKNIRRDIVVIDKELLRRSWYFTFLERNYPEVYTNSKQEIEKFLVELYKFEHSIPYDQNTIMSLFSEMMTSFVTKNPDRRVYSSWEIEQNKQESFAKDYLRIPDGLLFRLIKPGSVNINQPTDYKIYDFRFTPTYKKNYYHETIMLNYAMMLTNSAMYLHSLNRIPDAKKYLELALTAKPNYPQALELRKKLGF